MTAEPETTMTAHTSQPWEVTSASLNPDGATVHLRGYNHYHDDKPSIEKTFAWTVDPRRTIDSRYEFTRCIWGKGAMRAMCDGVVDETIIPIQPTPAEIATNSPEIVERHYPGWKR